MKKKKITTVLISTVIAIILFSVGIIVYATASNQNGLYAEIITDKESYSENDDIGITIRLENRNNCSVENVSIEGLLPQGLTLKNGETDKKIEKLEANEKVELHFVATKNNEVVETTKNQVTEQTTTKIQKPVKRKIKVKSIKLNKKKVTLKRKQSIKLKIVKIKPFNATNKKLKWSSSNKKVVKVNSKGKITALKIGKAKIYAKAKDGSGKKAICKVTVKKSKKKRK